MTNRYALYFTFAEADPLYQLASRWLGYDVYHARAVEFQSPDLTQSLLPYRSHVSRASIYGFHATLKAPFRLHPDKTRAGLIEAVEQLASTTRIFECAALGLQKMNDFIALVPLTPCARLNLLARNCVQLLEPFRDALTRNDIHRRDPHELSKRQRQYLQQWGYPYVLDEFLFHMTLTDRLPAATLDKIPLVLEPVIRPLLLRPLRVDRILLLQQDNQGQNFQVISIHYLQKSDD